MKRLLAFLLILATLTGILAGCGGGGSSSGNNPSGDTPSGDTPSGDTPSGDTPVNPPVEDGGPFVGNDAKTELCILSSADAVIEKSSLDGAISVKLTDEAATKYHTVRVPVDGSWDTVKVTQGDSSFYVRVYEKDGVSLIDFNMLANGEDALIEPVITANNKNLESEFGMKLANGMKINTGYYPGFVRKSVTFTIDDGDIENDKTFINIVNPAGIVGTFNICRVTDTTRAEYLSLYAGHEIANHHQLHALPFRETANYHTGKSFESILKDEAYSSSSDINYAYKTSIDGLYRINFHYYSAAYVGKTAWHAMASDETYFDYAEITKDKIESVFGEGSVVGFAYPHGVVTDSVKQYFKDMGYLYARKTGNLRDTTGFALPEDRFAWTYNADVSCMLDVMQKYDALEDDGELKFFAFGVHAADFVGKWDVLEEFAELYGNRHDEFWYASNRDIFEYEDAVKALEIGSSKIVNPSDVTVFVTVNDEKVVIPARSVYYYDGTVKALLTFDSDNGNNVKREEINVGSFANEPTAPTKNGFTFIGWYAGEEKWNFEDRITAGTSFVAKYTANEYEGPTAEVLAVKGGAGGIVCIIHDDGRSETGYLLDELYYKYSLVGDVAMIVQNVYNPSTGKPKDEYYNWKSIIDTGRWGVASHSLTHTWWGTVTKDKNGNNIKWEQSVDKMHSEIVTSQEILRNLFKDQRVLGFVYPGFGAEDDGLTQQETFEILYSKEAREIIDQYYVSARYAGENAPAYVDRDSDWMFQDGFFLFPSNINNMGPNSLFNRLESAANKGTIQLVSLHAVSKEVASGSTASGGYTIAYDDMEKACEMISQYVERGSIWNAHYDEAILYVREAQNSTVSVSGDENGLTVLLTDTMNDEVYNYPLTVRVTVPGTWEAVKVVQGDSVSYYTAKYQNGKYIIDADIVPDGGEATITPIKEKDIPYIPTEIPVPPASKDAPSAPPAASDLSYANDFNTELGVTGFDSSRATVETVLREGSTTDKVLKIDKHSSGSTAPTMAANTAVNNATELTFEFEINVEKAASGMLAQIFFNTQIAKSPIDFIIQASTSGYYFQSLSSYSGGSSTNFGSKAKMLSYGKYYTVKLHVAIGTADTFLATLYIDGELVGTTKTYLNPDKTSGYQPSKAIDGILIACQSASNFTAYLDNVTLTVK